ncbi:MAG: DUF3854 domain-containing protein [Nostoc indistinguendum CM1-VF10]|jgi:putative DNA primase/helicase|nr:DUF3854 domain-containing protein [Nostoc indistinguendum CM1-VF10]
MNTLEMQSAPGLSDHDAAPNNSQSFILACSAAGEQDLAAHSTKTASSSPKKGRQNQFESFEDFQAYIRKSFIEGSGIHPEIFDACVEFHQDIECGLGGDVETPIHEALGWEYKRFRHQANEPLYAAFLLNEDKSVWQVVVSIWDIEKQRPYKYFAPKGDGNRAFLPPLPIGIRQLIAQKSGLDVPMFGNFWQWVKESVNEVGATEGGKKSLSALSHGHIMIGLYGCECGAPGKPPALNPELAPFVGPGSTLVIAFDQDEKPTAVKAVNRGIRKLKLVLQNLGAYQAIVEWSPKDGKGLDDLIVNNGIEAFDDAYNKAIAYMESQFAVSKDSSTDKRPTADIISREIAEEFRDRLAYNNEARQWMHYEIKLPGVWSGETEEAIEMIVYQIITARGIEGYSTHSYITNIVKFLRSQLFVREWNERSPKELMPFFNGVLEIATGKFLPHSPGYRLTWQLPRSHDPQATDWSHIDAFLTHLAEGNRQLKDLLICYCNAVLKGRSDLQKFLHLIGLGGTGKGTFSRLIVNLIGKENVHSTTLDDWCSNRFEGANAHRKRLVLFADEDRQTGKLGRFLSLTGEDPIRAEEKGRKAFHYQYDGMVLVLSNLAIFMGDAASRVKRRVISFPCNNAVDPIKRRNLDKEFEPELAAFTNYVLSLSDDHVTAVIKGLQEIPECTLEFWENRTRVDSIAAWLNQCVIADPMAKTAIGCDRFEGEDGSTVTTLFGSYNRYCHKAGSKPKNHNNFSPDLLEMCRSVLGWSVEKESTKTGKFIRGLRLRVAGIDDLIPTHDYTLAQNLNKGDGTGDGTSDGSEPILSKCFPDGDGTLISQLEKQVELVFEPESQIDNSFLEENYLTPQPVENDLVINKSGLGFEPSPSVKASPNNGFEPSPQPSPQPSLSVTTRQPVKGDRVRLLSGGEEYKISWVSCGSDKVLLVSARTGQPLTAPSPLRPGAAAGGLNLIDISELEFLDT